MSAIHIKPCPFCGNANPTMEEVDMGVWALCCDKCNATGPISSFNGAGQTGSMAIEAWNRRPGEGLPAGIDEALNSGDGVYRP